MNSKKGMFAKEYLWRTIVTLCGLSVIVLTLVIGGFLVYKGSGTFFKFHHTIGEFLFSPDWAPIDNMEGGETKTALWTLALLLFLISLLFIFLIHYFSRKKLETSGKHTKKAVKGGM